MIPVLFSVMGIFPIMMNVLQFWLIDSIVKASAHPAAVALPDDATDDLQPENEPLFQLSDDEDEEDEGNGGRIRQVHDVENPRPPLDRSQSRPSERELSPLNEHKLRSTSKQPSASGSSTLQSNVVDSSTAESEAMDIHAYPPSNTVTPQSSVSSHRASSSRGSSRARRSPPPPLALRPRSPAPLAINETPQIPSAAGEAHHHHQHQHHEVNEKEWEAWDDNEEDWADRVGEEDWTGRRIEGRKATVDNVWALQHTPSYTGPIIRAGS